MDNQRTPWGMLATTLLIGGGVGFLLGQVSASEAPSAPDPAAAVPLTEAPAPTDTSAAAAEIAALEGELEEARAELATLRADDSADQAAVVAAEARITELEGTLAATRAELNGSRDALAESEALRAEQQEALVAVSARARAHQDASTVNLWHAFTNDAALEMCDRGSRAARERCQEELDAHFDTAAFNRFEDCVEEHGTVPLFAQAERGVTLPADAEPLTAKSGIFSRDWFVLYCDTDLPVNDDRLAGIPTQYGRL